MCACLPRRRPRILGLDLTSWDWRLNSPVTWWRLSFGTSPVWRLLKLLGLIRLARTPQKMLSALRLPRLSSAWGFVTVAFDCALGFGAGWFPLPYHLILAGIPGCSATLYGVWRGFPPALRRDTRFRRAALRALFSTARSRFSAEHDFQLWAASSFLLECSLQCYDRA